MKMALDLYFVGLWIARFILGVFFSAIEVVGRKNIPATGPVIFVGNHSNQFLDAGVLVATAGRPIGFLVAAVSMQRAFIGFAARMLRSIAVMRPQDLAKSGTGRVSCAQGSLRVLGQGTRFTAELTEGSALKVAGVLVAPAVARIVSDTELELKFGFDAAVDAAEFKIWPKLDHAQVYSEVWTRLSEGGTIGIFPEGGSHDNPHLLPLKAGVSVMALGAMDLHSDLVVKIVPVGLNYIHGHRFRSHVMVEYGKPIEVPWQLVLHYRKDKRAASEKLLEMIEARLRSVTLNYPSFHAQEQVTLARRLYQPRSIVLSADDFLALQRRFTTAFVMLRDDPNVVAFLTQLDEYHANLEHHGLRDYEVESLELQDAGVLRTLLLRFVVLLGIVMISIPGAALNAPLGLISRYLAQREALRALKKSEVKVKAQDVIASYKVLVAVFIVPVAWFFYVSMFVLWFGLVAGVAFLFALPLFSFVSVRLLEQGVQIWRSSSPILRAFSSSSFFDIVRQLQGERQQLVRAVRDLVEKILPLMGPEFAAGRVISAEALRLAEENEAHAASGSLIGVNRRVYKAKHAGVVQETFADFANEMDTASKPHLLGTSVEMERMHLFRKAEELGQQRKESK